MASLRTFSRALARPAAPFQSNRSVLFSRKPSSSVTHLGGAAVAGRRGFLWNNGSWNGNPAPDDRGNIPVNSSKYGLDSPDPQLNGYPNLPVEYTSNRDPGGDYFYPGRKMHWGETLQEDDDIYNNTAVSYAGNFTILEGTINFFIVLTGIACVGAVYARFFPEFKKAPYVEKEYPYNGLREDRWAPHLQKYAPYEYDAQDLHEEDQNIGGHH